jgi:hypothetical protein
MPDVEPLGPEKVAAEAAAIVAEEERTRWEPRLRALLLGLHDGPPHQFERNIAAVFLEMGGLRGKLLLAMGEPAWQQQEHGRSASSEAHLLLTLWGDPRDEAIALQTYRTGRWIRPAPVRLAGATLDVALEKWRDYHFKREGVPDRNKRTANWLRVLAQTEDCAYVEHHVRYRHWAYSTLLSVRKQGKQWVVRTTVEGRVVHFDVRSPGR